MRSLTIAAACVLLASTVSAQTPDANPYTSAIRRQQQRIASFVVRAAEKVPEDLYAFKPTPDVRTFAEVIGHIVDAQYLLCRAAGENVFEIKREFELKPGTKADLIAALKKSFDFCDTVFDGTTDANGTTPIKTGPSSSTMKLMLLN